MKKIFHVKRFGLWLYIVISLLVVIALFALSFVTRQMLIDEQKSGLQVLAIEKAFLVSSFLDSQKEKSLILATMNVFKDVTKYPNDQAKIEIAKTRINDLNNLIPGISILTKDGIVIVGEIDIPGTDYSGQPYFTSAKKEIVFEPYYDPLRKQDFYAVVGPIYDSIDKTKVIGTVAFDLGFNEINSLMKESLIGNSTEVYLINEKGLLLSDSKFIGQGNKNGVLIQEVDSNEAKKCLDDIKDYKTDNEILEHNETISEPYLNYMGNEVYGSHGYVPSIMGCVIAEKSSSEIMKFTMANYFNNLFNK